MNRLAVVVLALPLLAAGTARAGGDWNDSRIGWRPFDQGIAEARKTGRPVCLIFFTEWCPHCAAYSGIFHDDRVVERSKRFVMIRVDNDQAPELGKRFAPDGAYIPRTLFLSPKGELDASITAPRDRFRYFYPEHDPGPLLARMDEALRRLGGQPGRKR